MAPCQAVFQAEGKGWKTLSEVGSVESLGASKAKTEGSGGLGWFRIRGRRQGLETRTVPVGREKEAPPSLWWESSLRLCLGEELCRVPEGKKEKGGQESMKRGGLKEKVKGAKWRWKKQRREASGQSRVYGIAQPDTPNH